MFYSQPELTLIYRPKISGIGFHYGAILPDGTYLDFSPSGIRRCLEEEFKCGKQIYKEKVIPYTEAVRRRLNDLVMQKAKYDLVNFNCEHFARYLVEGERKSTQISFIAASFAIFGLIVLFND